MRPRGGGPLTSIRTAWPDVVGPAAAERTRLVAFEGGILKVDIESAALKHHLGTIRREDILKELQRLVEGVPLKGVRYRVGPLR